MLFICMYRIPVVHMVNAEFLMQILSVPFVLQNLNQLLLRSSSLHFITSAC